MIALPTQTDASQIQKLIAYGYTLDHCRYFVLRVGDPAKAQNFIAELLHQNWITAAAGDGANRGANGAAASMNIGFSFCGLEALELAVPYRRVFQEKAKAFAEGAWLRATRYLADTGTSAPQTWDPCFRPDRAHVLLSVHADAKHDLAAAEKALRALSGAGALDGWDAPLDGEQIGPKKRRRVHFGFRDGISNPLIKGIPTRDIKKRKYAEALHAPGEILLGYENDEGFNSWLLVSPGPTPSPWLKPWAKIDPKFFHNGSFAAFRKIEQNEAAFRRFVSRWAEVFGVDEEYIRAKLAGRWDDGQRVRPVAPETPDGKDLKFSEDEINAFDFSDDKDALGCPFGAHIRRMNPRADPIVPFRRRPLLRRGIPYGPTFDDDEKASRGLLGLFICASLEDQFEHLIGQWGNANPMGPDNRGNAKDPLVGYHEDPRSVFDIPVAGNDLRQLDGFSPFVTTRGTLYAFYPSLSALESIARIRS